MIAAKVPDAPVAAPVLVASSKESIKIQWNEPYDGGSPLTGYKVLMNGGGSSTEFDDVTLSGSLDTVQLTFQTAATLTTGEEYKFKVLAVNAVGDGGESAESLGILAAVEPTVPLSLQMQSQ